MAAKRLIDSMSPKEHDLRAEAAGKLETSPKSSDGESTPSKSPKIAESPTSAATFTPITSLESQATPTTSTESGMSECPSSIKDEASADIVPKIQQAKSAPLLLLPMGAVRSRRDPARLAGLLAAAAPAAAAPAGEAEGSGNAELEEKTPSADAAPKVMRAKSAPLLLPLQSRRDPTRFTDTTPMTPALGPGGPQPDGSSAATPRVMPEVRSPSSAVSKVRRNRRRSVTFGEAELHEFKVAHADEDADADADAPAADCAVDCAADDA